MVIYHVLVERDLREILGYYEAKSGPPLADFFFATVDAAEARPTRYHKVDARFRRARISGFPYHFLYRETAGGIRVSVLRHNKWHPSFGLRRS